MSNISVWKSIIISHQHWPVVFYCSLIAENWYKKKKQTAAPFWVKKDFVKVFLFAFRCPVFCTVLHWTVHLKTASELKWAWKCKANHCSLLVEVSLFLLHLLQISCDDFDCKLTVIWNFDKLNVVVSKTMIDI